MTQSPANLPLAATSSLAQPSLDTCPRCGGTFLCGVNVSTPCACSTLRLSDDILAALRSRYSRCLCLPCLQAIHQGAQQ